MTEEIQIIVPEQDDDAVSNYMVLLTRELAKLTPDKQAHGFLGGTDGYGVEFVTDVFEMHPYYWGDCTCGYEQRECAWSDANKHRPGCYQEAVRAVMEYPYQDSRRTTELQAACAKHGIPWADGGGCMVHCTCDYKDRWAAFIVSNDHAERCPIVLPNFRHAASGATVDWYKYIGRGMKVEAPEGFDWQACIQECIAAARSHLGGGK